MSDTGSNTHRVIQGGMVVDGLGNEPFAADIVIVDDRIVAVGANAGAEYPAAEKIDASGLTIMPGLIDSHLSLIHI